ncbi:putative ankyrin repeat protein RF_0381 [Microplitis mediator]|uniref:putative ankyrin repeat protein RF_0381 n=1 Tax=Microplitis mediator TaxID=375433 RepID=UPI0025576B9E|nr:putative ankyrin repeat protein RF_0381 [Microplitis mediator]XP_057324813.1 putative ankyrin repeat protein RF_0381 [Microplitis mediator]
MENLEKTKELERDLFIAIDKGNLAEIESIINSLELPSNTEWLFGYYLLCVALETKQYDVANLLLSKNVPVNNVYEKYRSAPLHWAIRSYNPELVKTMLDKGADINGGNLRCLIAFHIADVENNKKILELLIDHVSDNNIIGTNYLGLLGNLLDNGYSELAEKLLKKCSKIDITEGMSTFNLLCKSVRDKYYGVVEILIKRGIDVNFIDYTCYNSQTALYIACKNEDLKMVKLLLNNGASVNIKSGVYKDKIGYTDFDTIRTDFLYPIHIAIQKCNYEIILLLLDHGADLSKGYDYSDSHGNSTMHLACYESSLEIVKLLISRGGDICLQDENGDLPILEVVSGGNKDIFEYLIKNKNYNLFDYKNLKYILYGITEWEDSEAIEWVIQYIRELGPTSSLKYEIDRNLFADRSESPLLHSVAASETTAWHLENLIEYGADVNFVNSQGRTPLHGAFKYRKLPTIIDLLKYGADINSKCDDGYTPLDYVLKNQLLENRKTENADILFVDDMDTAEDIIEYTTEHILKLRCLNLYLSDEKYNDLINNFADPDRLKKIYNKEMESMKREIISDGVTYYNFVTANLFTSLTYLENNSIFEILKSKSYSAKFPEYENIIKGCFWRGLARKKLIDEISEYPDFKAIFGLPYPCMRNVFSYFSNGDLKNYLLKVQFLNQT